MANERVVEAVNFLIEAADYSSLAQEMTRTIERWKTHPMAYAGKLSCLNAMLDVGLQNREAFENLLKLVERKRQENPRVSKRDYQRDLMRDRRRRMAKALLLHETRHGRLRGAARMEEMQAIHQRWDRARSEFLAKAAPKTAAERQAAIQEFWTGVENTLDRNLANSRKTTAVA